jgi:hypothetical protein
MLTVNTDWEPLRTCVVGRAYPCDFYDWIEVSNVRQVFQEMAHRTEQFLQQLTETLQAHGVEVLRPVIPRTIQPNAQGQWPIPPLQPRNVMAMIGNEFYYCDPDWSRYYQQVRDASWADHATLQDFLQHAPAWQQQELRDHYGLDQEITRLGYFQEAYAPVIQHVRNSGTSSQNFAWVDGGQVSRAGSWLVVGTDDLGKGHEPWTEHFGSHRVRVVDSRGHVDGVFCILRNGLVVAHDDPNCVIDYHRIFPDWQVIKIKNHNLLQAKQQRSDMADFINRSHGHWWIPDIEHDVAAVEFIQRRFDQWLGNASETILDINMLVVDQKHVLMCGHNPELAEILDRHGLTPLVIPVPYPYFWDGGIHCMTAELHRSPVS